MNVWWIGLMMVQLPNINKEKSLSFLFHQSAPIAATAANAGQGSSSYISASALNADATYKNELSSVANIVKSFENSNNKLNKVFKQALN